MSNRLSCASIIMIVSGMISPGVAQSLAITNVHHKPEMFVPANNEEVTIQFVLSDAANVSINIYDDRSLLIRTFYNLKLGQGDHQINWDGKDQDGNNVPPEAYSYTISATDGQNTVEHDYSDYTGNQEYQVKDVQWNKKQKQFEYALNKSSRVFIRIGLEKHGPLLATILNWVPRNIGKHTEKWDGMDASGVLNLSAHPKMIIDMQAYDLTKNTILVGPKIVKSNYLLSTSLGEKIRQVKYAHKKKMLAAYQQKPETRGDYLMHLKLPDNLKMNNEGITIVSGILPIMLDVEDEYRHIAIDRRSEPVLYVDGQFAMENEVGYLPMTWRVDTSTMNEGEHYITVNLRGYEGNFGIATKKIHVKHQVNSK